MGSVIGGIEEISRSGDEYLSVEWRIPNFPSLPHGKNDWYMSPIFRIGKTSWRLRLYPNWKREAENAASGWMRLDVFRRDEGPPVTFRCSVGIRGSGGVENRREGEKEFKGYPDYDCPWYDFCWRSDLMEYRDRLMPDDTFTITCVMKRIVSAGGVCSLPSTQVAPTTKIQFSDRQDNDLRKKEVEALMEQIKTLEKTVESYELESQNYKKEISTLESEKLSIAEENKCLLEEKLTLEKDNDLHKKEVEALMEQIKTLQKTVENYELESQNYKKQISTLESENLSIAEEYKGLLEEKLTVVSGLEKEIWYSKVRIDELQEINLILVREKIKLDEEKSQYEIDLKKLKESAPFRNQDFVENAEKTSGYEREHLKDENSQSRSNILSCDFSDLYADEVSPNFVLKCNGWSIPVNTFVLSVRSNFFRDMFRNMVQENETGSADIKDLEVPVLMSMLKFLYCGKLEDVSEDTVADLYKAGDKYACSLKLACCQWMDRHLTQENCIIFLEVADSHSDQDLRAAVVSFIISHPGVMKTTAWLTLSNKHPKLANDVYQAYISSIIP